MINFQVYTLCHTLWLLRYEERALQLWVDKGISPSLGQPSGTPQFVPDTYKDHLKAVVNHGKYVADQLQFEAVHDRVNIFTGKVKYPMTIPEAIAELMVIREAIDTGIRDRYFYYYPYDKAAVLTKFPADWQKINDQFPSAKEDALAAVDCWALGHNTASVFHLMRVAEHGLRALARERRVKLPRKRVLEWGDWHDIIEGIRRKVEPIANKRRGPKRDAALEFYRGALGSFEGFKDAYRNNVMHVRKSYIEPEATAVREHVHHFMNRLADKIDETGKTQIKWGL